MKTIKEAIQAKIRLEAWIKMKIDAYEEEYELEIRSIERKDGEVKVNVSVG